MARVRRRLFRLVTVSSLALVVLSVLNVTGAMPARAGEPIYPDLQTKAPSNLQFDTEELADRRTHYVLRFDNVVENHGGRFEITADFDVSRDITQNIYDAEIGGNLVESRRVTADLIFHPTHNHFHLTDFARYSLYKKSSSGVYRETTRKGTKTSFCILDSTKVLPDATNSPEYDECSRTRQGLSAGWGDLYSAGLPDQWVDLGTRPLADGEYALHSTADPFNRIKESNDGNNTAVFQFTVLNGRIVNAGEQDPYCAVKPASVTVGAELYVSCDNLPPSTAFDLRWRYPSGAPVASTETNEKGELEASFVVPPTARGARYVIIRSGDSEKEVRAIADVIPEVSIPDAVGVVGERFAFSLTGFSPNSNISLVYQQTDVVTKTLISVRTDGNGSAQGTTVVPSSTAGAHTISASGDGGSPVTTVYTVVATLRLSVDSAQPGAVVQPTLRGFGNRERVDLTIVETGRTLRNVLVSSTGAANGSSTTAFTLPADMSPGTYTVQARGRTSGIIATDTIQVLGVQSSSVETPTATPEPSPIQEATATPTRIAEVETPPTVEPTPTEATTAPTAEATLEPQPAATSTAESDTPDADPADDATAEASGT